MGVSIFVWA